MIIPTVGRVVLYNPLDKEIGSPDGIRHAALVTMVHSAELVNLACFDVHGVPYHRQTVRLIQDPIVEPGAGECEWMPYQHGKAAKYDTGLDIVLTRLSNIEKHLASGDLVVDLENVTNNVVDLNAAAEGETEMSEFPIVDGVGTITDVLVEICADSAFLALQHYKAENGQPASDVWTDEQKERYFEAAVFILNSPGITAEEKHNHWCKSKSVDGWVFGEALDVEAKTTPNMVAFDALPDVEQHKTTLIIDAVLAAAGIGQPSIGEQQVEN